MSRDLTFSSHGLFPQFKNDIFISYRRISNEGRDKWLDEFCEQLRVQLAELVGDIKIWRDQPQIDAGDKWRLEIADALKNTAIFLAIISGTYFQSDQCLDELDQFLGYLKGAETRQGRIVPMFKQPTADTDMPPDLAEFNFRQ